MEYLRPSSLNEYIECSAKFYFNNIAGIKTPGKIPLAFGQAIHSTLKTNFRQKISTRIDLPIQEMKDNFSDNLDKELENVEDKSYSEIDSPKNLKDYGIELVSIYHSTISYRIFPKLVEEKISVKFKDYPFGLEGTPDMLDEDLVLIDHKTTGRDVKEIPENYRLQVFGAYPILIEALIKEPIKYSRIDFFIRKSEKNPKSKIKSISMDVDKKYFFSVFEKVCEGVSNNIFLPNRNHIFCTKRWCQFHEVCQKEFGGTIKP